MPELPELEALVETIAPPLQASPIARTPRAHFAVLKTGLPPLDALTGRTFTNVRRRGKHLLFEAGDLTLAVHLMTMGRIGWYEPETSKRPKGAVLEVHLEDGGALLATEGGTRKSMRVGLYDAAGIEGLTGHLGPEPLDDAFDLAALHAVLDKAPRQLNALLRDGREIAGIGRAFADEILHGAKLSPFQLSTRLDEDGRERLYTALKDVLRARRRRVPGAAGHGAAAEERRAPPADPRPRRRAVPALRRDAQVHRLRVEPDRLLPALPDRRQGARRPAHEPAAALAARSGRRARRPRW